MGIKENFTQAVRELTGLGDKKGAPAAPPESAPAAPVAPPVTPIQAQPQQSPRAVEPATAAGDTVERLKMGVYDDAEGHARELTLDSASQALLDVDVVDWEGSEVATIRPIAAPAQPLPPPPEPSPLFQRPQEPRRTATQQPPPFPQPQQQSEPQPAQSYSQAQPQPQPSYQQAIPHYLQSPVGFQPPPRDAAATRTVPRGEESELTVISRNTIVEGNIRSFADMDIDGDIRGDVETTKNVDLSGKVIGNIACNNSNMHMAQVQGNVSMKGNVSMNRDTLLIGDLMSTYAEINGKVKGNLDVVGKAYLREDSVVFGDISASTITVDDGAIIQGHVSTTFLNKEESSNLFPDTVVIGDVGSTRL